MEQGQERVIMFLSQNPLRCTVVDPIPMANLESERMTNLHNKYSPGLKDWRKRILNLFHAEQNTQWP